MHQDGQNGFFAMALSSDIMAGGKGSGIGFGDEVSVAQSNRRSFASSRQAALRQTKPYNVLQVELESGQ
jgi:hypothetical protein